MSIYPTEEAVMAVIELTTDNFNETIEGPGMVIVDFWAPWCGPCRSFAPTFAAASEKHADVTFAKVNTEEQQELAAAFSIRSIPTLMVFREQIILYGEPGALPAGALDQLIGDVRALDMDQVRADIAAQSS
jgi:thioredoxin